MAKILILVVALAGAWVQADELENCIEVSKESVVNCVYTVPAMGAAAGAGIGPSVIAMGSENMQQAGAALRGAADMGTQVNFQSAVQCQLDKQKCMNVCNMAVNAMNKQASVEQAQGRSGVARGFRDRAQQAQKIGAQCAAATSAKATDFVGDAAKASDAAFAANKTSDAAASAPAPGAGETGGGPAQDGRGAKDDISSPRVSGERVSPEQRKIQLAEDEFRKAQSDLNAAREAAGLQGVDAANTPQEQAKLKTAAQNLIDDINGKPVGDSPGALEKFFQENKGLIMGSAAALGAYALLSGNKKNDSKNNSNNSTNGAASGGPQNVGPDGMAKDANGKPINCKGAEGNAYTQCDDLTKVSCANASALTTTFCTTFTNRYCGFSQATNGAAQVNTAPGVGSDLCQDALAASFCTKAENANCYSCRDLHDRASAQCTQNPGLCAQQPTNAEMSLYKFKCPLDPVWTLPKWAGIQPSNSLQQDYNNRSQAPQPRVGVFPPPVPLPRSLVIRPGRPTPARDIASSNNRSLVNQTLTAAQRLCASGLLKNCSSSTSGVTVKK